LTILDGVELSPQNVAVSSNQIPLLIDENSGYETAFIKPGEKLNREAFRLSQSGKNMIVFVDSSYAAEFSNLSFGKRAALRKNNSVVFLLTNQVPKKFSIDVKLENIEQHLSNVLGILPGKNKYTTGNLQSDDIVVFSAHYDHIGVGKPVNGDSIYNGANDDASGTTAVMMLAKYFKELNNNDRTLVFVAFTAEEIGGYGSQYFSKQVNADGVVAMFNIEMIGTESKWGNNSAYITGYDKTDMGEILNQDLRFSGLHSTPIPIPISNYFLEVIMPHWHYWEYLLIQFLPPKWTVNLTIIKKR
jgi:Zn-dependent M28 family amino/carboxypeptidase